MLGVVGRAGVDATTHVVALARGRGPGVSPDTLPVVVHHAEDPVETSDPAIDFATMEEHPKMAAVPVQQVLPELAVKVVSIL